MITAPVFMPVQLGMVNPTGLYVLGGAQGAYNFPSFPGRFSVSTVAVLVVPTPPEGQEREYPFRVIIQNEDGQQHGAGFAEGKVQVGYRGGDDRPPRSMVLQLTLPPIEADVSGEADLSLLLTVDGERVATFPLTVRAARS